MTGVSVKVSHGVNLATADISSSLLSVVQTNQPVPESVRETTHSVVWTDSGKPSHLPKIVRRSLMSSRLSLPADPCLVSQCSTNFMVAPCMSLEGRTITRHGLLRSLRIRAHLHFLDRVHRDRRRRGAAAP